MAQACGVEDGPSGDDAERVAPDMTAKPIALEAAAQPVFEAPEPAAFGPVPMPAVAPERPSAPSAIAHTPKNACRRQRRPAWDAAVIVDITDVPGEQAAWPGAHVRCDGVRIAPGVFLTAAHCFAWHREPDTDAPPMALVRVTHASTVREPARDASQSWASHVAVHPQYPALACSQPSRQATAACARTAARCLRVHGRAANARSACLQSVSAQVIEAQSRGSHDLALVFVDTIEPEEPDAAPAQATLVRARAPGQLPDEQIWQSMLDTAGHATHVVCETHNRLRLSFDAAFNASALTDASIDELAFESHLFDGAFAQAPSDEAALQLVGWLSRPLTEMAGEIDATPLRYTRIAPHLLWILDTIASVSRVYPKSSFEMPTIADAPNGALSSPQTP